MAELSGVSGQRSRSGIDHDEMDDTMSPSADLVRSESEEAEVPQRIIQLEEAFRGTITVRVTGQCKTKGHT